MVKRLSNKEYWDDNYLKSQTPVIVGRKDRSQKLIIDYLEKNIKFIPGRKILEIGCGGSAWLPFFAREYGLEIYGIDYSEIGCQLLKNNLQKLGLAKYNNNILCLDIFKDNLSSFLPEFDYIISVGLIEHFTEAERVLSIFHKLLNNQGIIITVIPSIKGNIYSLLLKIFLKHVYEMHIPYNIKDAKNLHLQSDFKIKSNTYIGLFNLSMMPWKKMNFWPQTPKVLRRAILKSIALIGQMLFKIFYLLKIPDTRIFSPYIVTVARKSK